MKNYLFKYYSDKMCRHTYYQLDKTTFLLINHPEDKITLFKNKNWNDKSFKREGYTIIPIEQNELDKLKIEYL